ncbi:MAG: MerR family DNA-binding protein [Alphaproteobacteria bacterium]|jgi:DNA-binding transcriptional MerR regulator|nr:MerR family DNA-binding protein [Alphaproteobacteria bacterium]
MLTIGDMSRASGVKVPTIRYYEQIGLMPDPERNAGNQRRYSGRMLDRLTFIRHARDLGFGTDAIAALLELQDRPQTPCATANRIAQDQLADVRARIARLTRLQAELERMTTACSGTGTAGDCAILASLADHAQCTADH